MSERLVIDCNDLREQALAVPDGLRTVQRWMRFNRIDPNSVPVHSELVIEDTAFGPVIRYTAFRRSADGHFYADPDDPDRAASEERTALLQLLPPADWLPTTREAR